ncbi:MAG: hypothetical protein AAFO91_16910, partial [Bacteroidota bacterium]
QNPADQHNRVTTQAFPLVLEAENRFNKYGEIGHSGPLSSHITPIRSAEVEISLKLVESRLARYAKVIPAPCQSAMSLSVVDKLHSNPDALSGDHLN